MGLREQIEATGQDFEEYCANHLGTILNAILENDLSEVADTTDVPTDTVAQEVSRKHVYTTREFEFTTNQFVDIEELTTVLTPGMWRMTGELCTTLRADTDVRLQFNIENARGNFIVSNLEQAVNRIVAVNEQSANIPAANNKNVLDIRALIQVRAIAKFGVQIRKNGNNGQDNFVHAGSIITFEKIG